MTPGATPRRRPRRLVWLGVALLGFPVAELLGVLAVGRMVGGWRTLALLVAISVVGALVLRREGPATWRRFTQAARAGRAPSAELADAALVLVGGLLLVVPGFLTDVAGLVCLLPPTRPWARRQLLGWVARRLPSPPGGWGRADRVVEGEVLDPQEVIDRQDPDDENRPRPGGMGAAG